MVLVKGVVGLYNPVCRGTSEGEWWGCTIQCVVVLVKGGVGLYNPVCCGTSEGSSGVVQSSV